MKFTVYSILGAIHLTFEQNLSKTVHPTSLNSIQAITFSILPFVPSFLLNEMEWE